MTFWHGDMVVRIRDLASLNCMTRRVKSVDGSTLTFDDGATGESADYCFASGPYPGPREIPD